MQNRNDITRLTAAHEPDNDHDECPTWCNASDGHGTDHSGMRRDVSATADRDHFRTDANGGVVVPSVSAWLEQNGDDRPTYDGPGIGVNVYLPIRNRELETLLTPLEAEYLRDHLTALLEAVAQ